MRLSSVRVRSMDKVIRELKVVCPCLSVRRLTRTSGVLLRLALNCAMALGTLLSSTVRLSPMRAAGVRAMALVELISLNVRLSEALAKTCRIGFERQDVRAWQLGAQAGVELRSLAGYSMLSNIPRIKNVLPGLWKRVLEERCRLKLQSQVPRARAFLQLAVAVRRIVSFTIVELLATCVGLFSLHHKVSELRYPLRYPASSSLRAMRGIKLACKWFPFIGFANQITGIVDQEELRIEAVLRLFFSDEYGQMGPDEIGLLLEFNGVLLRELCQDHGFLTGLGLYVSLSSLDYQRLLVARRP
eukprot:TRINITY_DN25494_c0_g1_i1.p1 TRINITY_DN25494_c0_g1~~TRINITY_DN25494_c0_g1_i1.p1  ORF type:complete len:328 (+),score=39.94 TRINITY_DN25494_c0_g1_i1:82-984(+)